MLARLFNPRISKPTSISEVDSGLMVGLPSCVPWTNPTCPLNGKLSVVGSRW